MLKGVYVYKYIQCLLLFFPICCHAINEIQFSDILEDQSQISAPRTKKIAVVNAPSTKTIVDGRDAKESISHQSTDSNEKPCCDLRRNSTKCLCYDFSIGPHFNYMNVDFGDSDCIDGYVAGITANTEVTAVDFCNMYIGLDFEGTWDINFLRGDPCQKSSIAEYFLELKIGSQCWCFYDCLNVLVYTGFGWDRFINEQNPDLVSLCYRYDKLFVPCGIYLTCNRTLPLDVGFQFEWRPDVYSKLKINSITVDNKYQHAFRAQLPIKIHWCYQCCDLILKIIPFYDWNKFGRVSEENSNEVALNVPSTTRWNLGLRTLFEICF